MAACLKFVGMGKKIFGSIPNLRLQFQELHDSISNEMMLWQKNVLDNIKNLITSLKQTESDDPLILVRNLKKKLKNLDAIENEYM